MGVRERTTSGDSQPEPRQRVTSDGQDEILSDPNFQLLARSKTQEKEFLRLISENVQGYWVKKRLVEGLKLLNSKVDEAEQKLYYVKNLGKAKGKLEPDQEALIETYHTVDLKSKVSTLNKTMENMIDEGQLTFEEKGKVHEMLVAKRAAAKQSEKEHLVEKYERMLKNSSKGEPILLPLPAIEEIYDTYMQSKEIRRIEKKMIDKKLSKSLTDYDWEMVKNKAEVESAISAWFARGKMWFETDGEFGPRLEKAIDALTKLKAEQKKREEEEEIERKRIEAEEALEKKRLAHQEAEERRAKELEDKLEAKRQEAALKPVKEAPKAVKKEKAKQKRMNPLELFVPPPRAEWSDDEKEPENDENEQNDNVDAAASVAEQAGKETAPTPAVQKTPPSAAPVAPKASVAVAKPKPKAKEKVVLESKWGATPAVPLEVQEALAEEDGVGPSLADSLGPSLLDAAKAPAVKKAPVAQPKKKEKKKFTKLGVDALGFDHDNQNLPVN